MVHLQPKKEKCNAVVGVDDRNIYYFSLLGRNVHLLTVRAVCVLMTLSVLECVSTWAASLAPPH